MAYALIFLQAWAMPEIGFILLVCIDFRKTAFHKSVMQS